MQERELQRVLSDPSQACINASVSGLWWKGLQTFSLCCVKQSPDPHQICHGWCGYSNIKIKICFQQVFMWEKLTSPKCLWKTNAKVAQSMGDAKSFLHFHEYLWIDWLIAVLTQFCSVSYHPFPKWYSSKKEGHYQTTWNHTAVFKQLICYAIEHSRERRVLFYDHIWIFKW